METELSLTLALPRVELELLAKGKVTQGVRSLFASALICTARDVVLHGTVQTVRLFGAMGSDVLLFAHISDVAVVATGGMPERLQAAAAAAIAGRISMSALETEGA